MRFCTNLGIHHTRSNTASGALLLPYIDRGRHVFFNSMLLPRLVRSTYEYRFVLFAYVDNVVHLPVRSDLHSNLMLIEKTQVGVSYKSCAFCLFARTSGRHTEIVLQQWVASSAPNNLYPSFCEPLPRFPFSSWSSVLHLPHAPSFTITGKQSDQPGVVWVFQLNRESSSYI